MSFLDDLLGGNSDSSNVSSDSNSTSFDLATNPTFGLVANDVLQIWDKSSDGDDGESNETSITGIGGLGIGLAAPTSLSFDSTSKSMEQNESDGDDGGLLSGLL